MIYFEASEIYSGIINALLLGMLFGGIYGSLCSLNNGIMRFLSVILFLFLSHKECRKRLSNFRQSREKSKIVNEIFDFLFFLSAGVLYIFFLYIALDGIFRVYILIVAISGFYISHKSFGRLFDKVINITVCAVNVCWSYLVYFLTFPIRAIIYNISAPLCSRIVNYLRSVRYSALVKRKLDKIDKIF